MIVANKDIHIGTTGVTLENLQKYSTTEVKIGTWIDGKPMYRKVIKTTLSSSTGFVTYNLGISNIKEIIKQDIQFWNTGANGYYKVPYYESSSYFVVGNVMKNGTSMLTQKGFGGSDLTFIIEYTKTTD